MPLQMRAMRDHAAKRGWTIALEIKEVGSGAAQRELREKLLDLARRREIDVVLTASKKSSRIRELYRAGVSKAEIPRKLNIGRTSVRRILAVRTK